MTQIEKVIEKIQRDGYVDNFWAIENFMLRLGAIIHTLRHERGMVLHARMGAELDPKLVPANHRKNCYYLTDEALERLRDHRNDAISAALEKSVKDVLGKECVLKTISPSAAHIMVEDSLKKPVDHLTHDSGHQNCCL